MFPQSDWGAPAPILTGRAEALLARSRPIGAVDADARASARRLVATLKDFQMRKGFGRAIAAPQIGIRLRMIAVDLGAGPFVLFDPSISWKSDETQLVWDDCMSVPDQIVRVRRHVSISIDYTDINNRRRSWNKLPASLAELLQHELDHLDGVLMTSLAEGDAAIQPAERWSELVGAGRPEHRLSLKGIEAASRLIDPVFLNAPYYQSDPLSEELGAQVMVKVETLNPVRCFKGRGADYFLHTVDQMGSTEELVCASAGNFGQAWACRRSGRRLTVFAAETANAMKIGRMKALGANVCLSGRDFDAAKAAAKAMALDTGAWMVEDGKEPPISEGAGTMGREIIQADSQLDAIVVPLGNGALLGGVARWIKAACPGVELIGAVASGAPSMDLSFRQKRGSAVITTPTADTIADGVGVREPIHEAVDDLYGIIDDIIRVDDLDTIECIKLAHRHLGVVLEPAGAIGLGGLLGSPARLKGKRVAVVLTGGNLSQAHQAEFLNI